MLISISGAPGVGKTTIIKKVMEYLKSRNVKSEGFITEEIRDSQGYRIGFDVVTLKEERGILARKSGVQSKYRVGSYLVDIVQFEKLAIPLLNNPQQIMIIDEIGKMELFSDKFKNCVANIIANPDLTVLATVPMRSNHEFIEKIKRESSRIFYVTQANRNNILEELIKMLQI